jgi:hypothetical protein
MPNETSKDTAAATKRAAEKVPEAIDRAFDNTPTKPGTEAEKASSGDNQTRPDSAQGAGHQLRIATTKEQTISGSAGAQAEKASSGENERRDLRDHPVSESK